MSAAKDKGSAVQRNTATWYQRIWPYATTQGAGVAGRDIQHVPVSIEVKARRGFSPLEWMKQVRKAARPGEDELPPWVVMCPYGLGQDKCEDFLVIQRLEDHTAIVRELLALRKLYDKWWNHTATYEGEDSKYALVPYDDLSDMEEICVEVEKLHAAQKKA